MERSAIWTPEGSDPLTASVIVSPSATLTWKEYLAELQSRLSRLIRQEGAQEGAEAVAEALDEAGEAELAEQIRALSQENRPDLISELVIRQSESLQTRLGNRWSGKTQPIPKSSREELVTLKRMDLGDWLEMAIGARSE